MLRPRLLGLILALSGAGLLASLWMPWYKADSNGSGGAFFIGFVTGPGNPLYAWNQFGQIDWILAAVAVCAFLLAVRPLGRGERGSSSLMLRALLVAFAGLALAVYRLADSTLDGGAILGTRLEWTADSGAALALVSLCSMIAALAGLALRDLEPERALQLDDPRGGLGDARPEAR